MNYILLTLVALSLDFFTGHAAKVITSCKKSSDCACITNNGDIIDLRHLGKVTYKNTAAGKKQDYAWGPCTTFPFGTLKGVTAGQHDFNLFYDIGTDPNVDFKVTGGVVQIHYTSAKTAKTERKSLMTLTCSSSSSTWTFTGENPQLTYNFELKSPLACPVPNTPSKGGLSIGSILTIVFFVMLLSYVIFGVLFKVVVRKSQGAERVPNLGFWTVLPGLIRDGFKFTLTCGSRSKTYDQL